MNGSNSHIPTVDVTDQASREALYNNAVTGITNHVVKGPAPTLFMRVEPGDGGAPMLSVVTMAMDEELFAMAVGLVSMIGAAKLGEAAMDAMPGPLAQATAQATGLRMLHKYLQDSMHPAATPASDAGSTVQ